MLSFFPLFVFDVLYFIFATEPQASQASGGIWAYQRWWHATFLSDGRRCINSDLESRRCYHFLSFHSHPREHPFPPRLAPLVFCCTVFWHVWECLHKNAFTSITNYYPEYYQLLTIIQIIITYTYISYIIVIFTLSTIIHTCDTSLDNFDR